MSLTRLLLARVAYLQGSLHRAFGNRTGFRREHENAARCFTRAYRLDPLLRAALLDRGILFWREMDRLPEALADFDTLLAADPAYSPALLNRGLAYHAAGRFPEALADLEAFLARADESALAGEPVEAVYLDAARRIATELRDMV